VPKLVRIINEIRVRIRKSNVKDVGDGGQQVSNGTQKRDAFRVTVTSWRRHTL